MSQMLSFFDLGKWTLLHSIHIEIERQFHKFLSKQANVSTLLSKSFCMEDLFSISFPKGFDAGVAALPPLPFLYHTKKKHDMSKQQQEETLYLETTSPGSDRN